MEVRCPSGGSNRRGAAALAVRVGLVAIPPGRRPTGTAHASHVSLNFHAHAHERTCDDDDDVHEAASTGWWVAPITLIMIMFHSVC